MFIEFLMWKKFFFYFIFTVNFDGKTISYNMALFMYDDDEVKGKTKFLTNMENVYDVDI